MSASENPFAHFASLDCGSRENAQVLRSLLEQIIGSRCQRWTLWGLDIRDLEILGTGSWSLGGQVGAVEQWVEGLASGIGVWPKHGRSGDPGLWVRNKEQ